MCLAVVVYPDYVALLAALTVTKDPIVLAGASTLIAVYYLCCFWLRVVSSLSTSAYIRWALFGLICCCMLPFREAINFLDTLIFSWFSIWITCCIILGEVGRLGKAYCSVVRKAVWWIIIALRLSAIINSSFWDSLLKLVTGKDAFLAKKWAALKLVWVAGDGRALDDWPTTLF